MSTFNEKAGTFILTAVQAVNDVKKMVEERVKALVKDAMVGYDAELSAIKERLDIIEKKVRIAAEKTAPAAKETAPKPKKARPRKKAAKKPVEPAKKSAPAPEPPPPEAGQSEPAAE